MSDRFKLRMISKEVLRNFVAVLWHVTNPFVDPLLGLFVNHGNVNTFCPTDHISSNPNAPFPIQKANKFKVRSSKRGLVQNSPAMLSMAGGCRSLAKRIGSPSLILAQVFTSNNVSRLLVENARFEASYLGHLVSLPVLKLPLQAYIQQSRRSNQERRQGEKTRMRANR